MQIDNPESWKISAEERAKHTATFMQLNPAPGGLLSGDQAKGFFLKSGLPMPVLGQIWNLADLNKDGKLDVKEFSIACFLIKRALTSPQGPACIPHTLPHSLLVDPTSSSSIAATPIIGPPKTNIVLPATTTPLIGASPLIMPSTTTTTPLIPASSNTPLFQANFPPMSQTPIVGLSAPHTTATATPLVGLGSTPLFPLGATATSPPHLTQLAPASTSTPMAPLTSSQLPGAVFTPLVPLNQPTAAFQTRFIPYRIPNPLSPIPQTSRSKYGQMFQSNDPTSSGFITGNQARTLLMQTGLAQPILAQIWNLADYDKDGKLTYEEFILAMHLCDYAKTGATLPGTLPADLIPPRSRSSSLVGNSIAPALTTTLTTATTGGAMTGFDAIAAADASPTLSAKQQGIAATFEDKRRENFDRGAAVLEAKRAALREQEEREKREREEKERLEQEKRQRIREEQEKRRLAEIERAQERQRQIDAQREEERRKAHEQREQARNELIRQQRLEWEKQKRLELEQTRLKLQEQLSTLKAKDKNLEYDLHALNDKISSYKTKISDNQTNLTELNQRLDVTKKSYAHKQGECEASENELKEITQLLSRLGQEKLVLNEQLKNLNADSPFAEEYRNDSHQLKQKQSAIQQLRADVEAIETRINSTRTQLEIVRHELEVTRGDEADYERENERLRSLLDIKRGIIPSNKIPASMSNGSLAKQVSNSANIMKSSQSNGSLRSATPKENYAAFKDEIMKIQQTTNTPPPTTTTADPFGGTSSTADPFGGSSTTAPAAAEFSSDWSAAFDSSSANQAAATEDPFASGIDPFAASSSGQEPTSSDFDPFGMPATNAANLSSSVSGFGDDNWAAFAAASNSTIEATNNSSSSVTNNEAVAANNANTNTNATTATPNSPPPIDAFSNQDNTNSNAANNSSNWAAFDDGPTNTTTNGGVKNAVDFFNSQQHPVSSPTTKNSTMTPSNSFQQRLSSANSIKYRAMYQFDASREDELSIKEGDIVNVDISVKTDDGWVWGELNGRTGVFPAAFAAKLSDLEGHSQPDYSALGNVNLPMQSGANVAADSHIINYYMSVYAYESSEPGDLVFGEYEIINVVSQNEDWFTGEVVGAEQSRRGIFPTNFVIKFNLPLEYIGKYTISIATEIYVPMNPGELSLDPNHNQLIAIKKVSPDGKWSFGESYDTSGKMSRGWFPIGSASALIPSGATPLYSPNQTAMSNGPKSPTAANGASLATNNISTASSPEPPPPTSTTSPSTPEAVAAVATADIADSATVASVTAAIATDNDGTSAANNAINASSTVTTNNNHTNGSNGTSNGVEKPTTVKKSTTNGSISSTSKTVASSENRAQTPPQVAAVAEIEKSPSSPSTTSGSQGANDSGASQQSPPSTAAAAPPTQVIDRVVALYDFNPTTPEAIGFPKDAVINILDKSGDWWYGEYNGKIGILPYNYVQSIATDNPTNEVVHRKPSIPSGKLTDNKQQHQTKSSVEATITNTNATTNSRRCLSLSASLNRIEGGSITPVTLDPNQYYSNYNRYSPYDSSTSEDSSSNLNLNLNNPNNNSAAAALYVNNDFFEDPTMLMTSLAEQFNAANVNNNNNNPSSEDSTAANEYRIKETDARSKMRLNVIGELIQTEKNYVKSLRMLIELYKNPLQQNRVLNPNEIEAIFVNIDEILIVNTKFLNALAKRIDEGKQIEQIAKIGDILVEFLPKFHIYARFVSSKRIGEELVLEKMRTSADFMSFITKSIASESSELIFKKLLLLPMQRLTQYSLLVDKLLKYIPESELEYGELKTASKQVIDLIKSINHEVGKKDDLEKLDWLDEHINLKAIGLRFRSATNIMGPRKLYYYGSVVKESGGKELFMFLFNDLILIVEANDSLQNEIFRPRTSPKFQQLQVYKQPIILDTILGVQTKITSNNVSSDCSFQILCADKEYSLKTTNPTLKNEWIKQLQKAVELYKQKKRSLTQSLSGPNISQKNPIGRFLLLVMEAQDILPESNDRNVFCEAILGLQKFSTHAIESGNPKWNTSMQFQIYDLNKDVLSVCLFDRKVYSPNVFLGKTELKIIQIYREQVKENQENHNPITRVFRMSNNSTTKIMLKMSISIYK